jgi:hypothetical protein
MIDKAKEFKEKYFIKKYFKIIILLIIYSGIIFSAINVSVVYICSQKDENTKYELNAPAEVKTRAEGIRGHFKNYSR